MMYGSYYYLFDERIKLEYQVGIYLVCYAGILHEKFY